MIIEMTRLLNTLTMALDYVENEIIKNARNHGKRVAVMTNLMAKEAGYDQETVYNKMGAAGQLDKSILQDIDICFKSNDEEPEAAAEPVQPTEYQGETWVCPVCGYVYQGKLPENFICPKCEQPGTLFERVHGFS